MLPWTPRAMLLGDFTRCKIGTSEVLLVNMLAATSMLIAVKWKLKVVPYSRTEKYKEMLLNNGNFFCSLCMRDIKM